jgi:hypothetical protein
MAGFECSLTIERASAIREVIAYLRKKTGEDLGDDPQKWIEKYGKAPSA